MTTRSYSGSVRVKVNHGSFIIYGGIFTKYLSHSVMAHLSFIESSSFGIWVLMAHLSFIESSLLGIWVCMAHSSFIESSSLGIWVLMAHWSLFEVIRTSHIRARSNRDAFTCVQSWRMNAKSWLLCVRAHSFMQSHDSCMCVLIHSCQVTTLLCACSFMSIQDSWNIKSWLFYVRAHSNHDSFMTPLCMHVMWLIHLCDMTGYQEYLWHDTSIYACSLGTTHSYVRRNSFILVNT